MESKVHTWFSDPLGKPQVVKSSKPWLWTRVPRISLFRL